MYMITYLEKRAELDHYEKGCMGKSTTILFETNLGIFETVDAALKSLANRFGVPETLAEYLAFDDNRLSTNRTETADGMLPSKRELELFKTGELELYLADFDIGIQQVAVSDITVKQLLDLGAQQY